MFNFGAKNKAKHVAYEIARSFVGAKMTIARFGEEEFANTVGATRVDGELHWGASGFLLELFQSEDKLEKFIFFKFSPEHPFYGFQARASAAIDSDEPWVSYLTDPMSAAFSGKPTASSKILLEVFEKKYGSRNPIDIANELFASYGKDTAADGIQW